MNSIFDYARKKIRKKHQYNSSCETEDIESPERKEKHDLRKIAFYEEEAKKGFIKAIKYRFKAFKMSLTDNEVSLLFFTALAIVLALFIFIKGVEKNPINISLLATFRLFFEYVVVITIYFIYCLIRHKIIKSPLYYIVWALFFVLSIPHIPVLIGYQTTQIGDFYEAREYKAKYYVIMSREPGSVNSRQQYTLPAEIERRKDYLYTTDITEDYFFQEHGGHEVYGLIYHINRLYLPNGGYLIFNYDAAYDNPEDTDIELNKETEVIDYHDDTYYITLTDRKVSE